MALEIERKFLVSGDFRPFATHSTYIAQAYLCVSVERTIRVRIKGQGAFITIKGASDANGFSRLEFEYAIPLEDAREMMSLSPFPVIQKERFYVPYGKHTYEVDVFHGQNEGLILAELELEHETESFEKPAWLGKEVTGDKRYYNAFMAQTSSHS